VNADVNDYFAIKSITAYQSFEDNFSADFDGTGFELTPNTRGLEADTFTQELNLLFDTDVFGGVLGAFYMDDTSESSNRFDFGPGGIALTRDITNPDNPQRQQNDPPPGGTVTKFTLPRNDTESFAIFADATFNITDQLSVFGGIRYSEDTINIEQFHTNDLFFFPAPINGPAIQFLCRAEPGFPFQPAAAPVTSTPLASELSYNSTTPRVGVNYEFSGESSVYASYSEGFKTGGFNTQTGCGDGPDEQFDSEEVNSFEIGTKNTLLDGTLILNASAYFYDYENLQVEQLLGFGFAFENAEGAEVYGVEFETLFAPDDHWTITGNLSLQSSEFTDFENVDSTNNFTRDANGAVVTTPDGNALPFVQQLAGNTLPYAPDMTANLGVTYRTNPVLAGGSFVFSGSASYQSEINFREFENPNDVQDAYTLLDGSIAWENAAESLTVRLYGKNIFDEEYIVSAAPGSATNSNFGVYGLPRQYGIELLTRF
jgi:iron complex outermembrane receptor protein